MEIKDIKQRLTIREVLAHYGLKPDRNGMLSCPFHEDKTPSMQVYQKTNTVYCFSANCQTHSQSRPGGSHSLDVIDFIWYKEGGTKHQAIKTAQQLINPGHRPTGNNQQPKNQEPATDNQPTSNQEPNNQEPATTKPGEISNQQLEKTAILTKVFSYFKNGLYQSKAARAYVQSRHLDPRKLEAGYNSGQFHHRENRYLVASCLKYGLLKPGHKDSKKGGQGAKAFAPHSIAFPLKDPENRIVSLYFRSVRDDKHFYLTDRQGLYPGYPAPETKKIILSESIIDCATLQQQEPITSKYSLLALYGTNGLSEEHSEALSPLPHLEEIILFMDGDQAGEEAARKYSRELQQLLPRTTISKVPTPEGEDINSLLDGHSPEILEELLGQRQPFSFSTENKTQPTSNLQPATKNPATNNQQPGALDTSNPEQIIYKTALLTITISGGVDLANPHRLKLSLCLEHKESGRSFRDEVNLYSHRSRQTFLDNASEELEISPATLKTITEAFTRAVETHRMQQRAALKTKDRPQPPELSNAERQEAVKHLSSSQLSDYLKTTIHKAGLVGETDNGLLLFLIFVTRFFDNPLHALVHGSSGSGKTNLLKTILKLIPDESKYATTALTENVLFRPPYEDFWQNKILLLEDLDGSYNALLPLRELMSNQYISKFSSEPNPKTGQFEQKHLEAQGPIVIAGATTKDKVYEDNANRSFLIHVDESKEHQQKILDHQNKQAAGLIDTEATETACQKIHNLQRMLNPEIKVVNPFQPQLKLPDYVFKKLRTNTHYITLIKAITFLHQYQRATRTTTNGQKYIETTLEDVALANTLSKHSLLRKSDELSGQVRGFFEALKRHLMHEHGEAAVKKGISFLAKEMRSKLRMHPMKFSRYINELRQRGYIKKTAGKEKGSFEYRIEVWDDYQVLQKGLDVMDKVLDKLYKQYPDGTYQKRK